MRHTRLVIYIFALLGVFLLSNAAFADSTVNMQFLGPGGNNGGGVYTYPYSFSINGGPSTALICDTFDNEVKAGETWTATVSGLLSGNGLFGDNILKYKTAGLIFQGIVAGTINPTLGNWAIWGLFSTTAQNDPYFTSSGASTLVGQYMSLAATAQDSDFANLVIYTPIAGTQSWGGTPQEYIGMVQVAEPGALLMLAFLLATGLLVFRFRDQLGLKLAVAPQA